MTERTARLIVGALVVVTILAVLLTAGFLLTPVTRWDTDCGSVLRPFADDPPDFCRDEFGRRTLLASLAMGVAVVCVAALFVVRRVRHGSRPGANGNGAAADLDGESAH